MVIQIKFISVLHKLASHGLNGSASSSSDDAISFSVDGNGTGDDTIGLAGPRGEGNSGFDPIPPIGPNSPKDIS